jgi:hypothetical protein
VIVNGRNIAEPTAGWGATIDHAIFIINGYWNKEEGCMPTRLENILQNSGLWLVLNIKMLLCGGDVEGKFNRLDGLWLSRDAGVYCDYMKLRGKTYVD